MYSKKQKTSFQGTIFYQKKKKKTTQTQYIFLDTSQEIFLIFPYGIGMWYTVDKYATCESQPRLENMSFFFLPFFPFCPGDRVSLCSPGWRQTHRIQPLSTAAWQIISLLSYATSQYFMILFSHSNRVLSMNTTQLIFLLGKKRHQWQYVTYTNIWDHL